MDLARDIVLILHFVGLASLLGGASVACGVALTATSGWLIVQASTRPVILTLMVAIVGVRAFGTQLLCEQVVGRGLRRMS